MPELNFDKPIPSDDAQGPERATGGFLASITSARELLRDQHNARSIEEDVYTSSLAVLAQLESAQEEGRDGILKKAYGSGDISKDFYKILGGSKDTEEFPMPEDVYARTKEGSIDPLPPDFFKSSANETVDAFTESPDALRAVIHGAAPDLPLQDREKIADELENGEGKPKLSARLSESFKNLPAWELAAAAGVKIKAGAKHLASREFLVGAATGAGARAAIRLTFGGGSLGIGIAAGAVGGGLTGGIREYLSERGKVASGSVIQKIREANNMETLAAVLARAEEAYKKGRINGSEEEIGTLANNLREARVLIASSRELSGNDSETDKIFAILEIANGARKSIPPTLRKKAEALIKEVAFERKKVDRSKIAKAALRGAAVGAVSGAIGGALANYFSEHIHLFGHGASAVKEITPQARNLAGASAPVMRAMTQEIMNKKAEAAGAATRKVLEKAQAEILQQKFTAVVEKGDGATHVARKIIHDYLVNQGKLNPDAFQGLSSEQMVYVEDTLQKGLAKTAEKGFHLGDHFELPGEDISKAIGKAVDLSPEKIGHLEELLKDPAHHLSSKTVEQMANLQELTGQENNFYTEVIKKAHEAAVKAAAQIHEVIPAPHDAMAETLEKSGKGAENVAEKIPTSRIIIASVLGTGAVIATAGAFGIAAKGIRNRRMEDRAEAGSVDEVSPTEGGEDALEIPELALGLPFMDDTESSERPTGPDISVTDPVQNEFAASLQSARDLIDSKLNSRDIGEEERESSLAVLAQLESAKEENRTRILKKAYASGDISPDMYKILDESADVSSLTPEASGRIEREAEPSPVAQTETVSAPARKAQRAEKSRTTQELFNNLVKPYEKKGILISVTEAVDKPAVIRKHPEVVRMMEEAGTENVDKSAVIRRFPEIAQMIEEIGEEKLKYTVINFFKPAYGVPGAARMFTGNTQKKGVRYKVMNVNIDSPAGDIKKFIEEHIT